MDLQQLNTTLTGIENSLLRRKVVQLEATFDELDEGVQELEEAYEIAGQAVDTSAASGGTPPEETYQGYDVGREGDRHMDSGGTKTAAAERARAHAKAMQGGPDDKGVPQSTSAAETRAHSASSKGREDRGDIDHGHA
jgi:hypothetical protein